MGKPRKRLRRATAFLCITPAVIGVLLFNIVQEPALAILFGAFELSNIAYLITITALVIFTSLLVNSLITRAVLGRFSCPSHQNPFVSWEWALFASVIIFYPLGLRGVIDEQLASTIINFSSGFYVTAVVFAIGITFLWLAILRFFERRSKKFEKFLNRLEIVTSGETVILVVASAFVGVTLRFLLDKALLNLGFLVPHLV